MPVTHKCDNHGSHRYSERRRFVNVASANKTNFCGDNQVSDCRNRQHINLAFDIELDSHVVRDKQTGYSITHL